MAMLAVWKRGLFAKIYGRSPMPYDYVVPTRRRGKRAMSYRRPHASFESHSRDCEASSIAPRCVHGRAHTFILLARGDGARADMVEKVTHNAKAKMIDHYTHLDFMPKCQAVGAPNRTVGVGRTVLAAQGFTLALRFGIGSGSENPLFLAGNLATPTGSAQYKTTAKLLKSEVLDAVGERFGPVELVA
jgi:hypothetical protein